MEVAGNCGEEKGMSKGMEVGKYRQYPGNYGHKILVLE